MRVSSVREFRPPYAVEDRSWSHAGETGRGFLPCPESSKSVAAHPDKLDERSWSQSSSLEFHGGRRHHRSAAALSLQKALFDMRRQARRSSAVQLSSASWLQSLTDHILASAKAPVAKRLCNNASMSEGTFNCMLILLPSLPRPRTGFRVSGVIDSRRVWNVGWTDNRSACHPDIHTSEIRHLLMFDTPLRRC